MLLAYWVASGLATTREQGKYMKIKDAFYAEGFTAPELASIINDIYKDASNIRIPIFEVQRVAIKKAGGLSQQKVEEMLSGLRQELTH